MIGLPVVGNNNNADGGNSNAVGQKGGGERGPSCAVGSRKGADTASGSSGGRRIQKTQERTERRMRRLDRPAQQHRSQGRRTPAGQCNFPGEWPTAGCGGGDGDRSTLDTSCLAGPPPLLGGLQPRMSARGARIGASGQESPETTGQAGKKKPVQAPTVCGGWGVGGRKALQAAPHRARIRRHAAVHPAGRSFCGRKVSRGAAGGPTRLLERGATEAGAGDAVLPDGLLRKLDPSTVGREGRPAGDADGLRESVSSDLTLQPPIPSLLTAACPVKPGTPGRGTGSVNFGGGPPCFWRFFITANGG